MNGRERILAMLAGEPVDRLPRMPITMMFASDQIGVAYEKYVTDYCVLAEAQIQTAEKFDLDHVSCISDPAREAADCGANIRYFEDQPPAIDESEALLKETNKLGSLRIPDPLGNGRMQDRVRAVSLLKEKAAVRLLVEGWVEGPCAEGADLRGLNALMLDFFDNPGFVHDLFSFTTELGISFAKAQIDAGADIIGVGDAAASLVGPKLYEAFVWPYEKKLVDALHELGTKVRLHICGDTSHILSQMGKLGCDIVDLDSFSSLGKARKEMGPDQVLAGNINPVTVLRNGPPEGVRSAIAKCHAEAGSKYILAAGCEVPRDTPRENFLALINYS